LKKQKPWFDKECSELLDQRKETKLQMLQDPSEKDVDNLNSVRCEASTYFKNKKREYLKDKINELAMNSKNKNIRDLYSGNNEFKRGYQSINNLVKYENGDLLADSHNILNRWKNYFSQLLNVHNVSDVRKLEVHTAEPLVPWLIHLKVEIAIAKLKKYELTDNDQIPEELIKAGGETILSLEVLGFWTLSIVWNYKYKKTQHFKNWVCFHPKHCVFLYLEFWMIEKIQKPSAFECYTPVSECFSIY
jgi:hypothetical protein